jgi:DNA-binding winged helix-turn-helix (wHTH) protein
MNLTITSVLTGIRFGPFEFRAYMLFRDGRSLRVGSRALLILGALLSHKGRVVPYAELMDAAWPGLHVEDTNLRVQIAGLRRVIEAPDQAVRIVNHPGQGYALEEGGDVH